jgi:hypothetical protein
LFFFTKIQRLFYNLGQKKDARVKAKAYVAFSFYDFRPVLDVRPSYGLKMGLPTYRDVTSFYDFRPVLDVRPSCGLKMGLPTYRDVTCLS